MSNPGLYIHVPFCSSKCIYCDFYSGGVKGEELNRFTDGVVNELIERKGELRATPDTLYIGGGTPSLLSGEQLLKLSGNVSDILNKKEAWKEFTLEVNPDDVTDDKCRNWSRAGVNRISMGVQSFNDKELTILHRRHDSITAIKAYKTLQNYFDNISIDLIFGLPSQTLENLKSDISKVLELLPNHLSAYSLMIEEKTPLSVMIRNGSLKLPDDDDYVRMWEFLSDALSNKGYHHYEISNYGLPGFEAIHNMKYWQGAAYLGLGPSAHSYNGVSVRRSNPPDLKGYLKRFENIKGYECSTPFYNEEILNSTELSEERVMLELRMDRGIDLKKFEQDFGKKSLDRLIGQSRKILSAGKIEFHDHYLRLTKEGIMVADDIILELTL